VNAFYHDAPGSGPITRRYHLLWLCMIYESSKCFTLLMSKGEVNVNSAAVHGDGLPQTCLFTFCIANSILPGLEEGPHLSFLRQLAEHSSIDVNATSIDENGSAVTPLEYAVVAMMKCVGPLRRQISALGILIDAGANPSRGNAFSGLSPIQLVRMMVKHKHLRPLFLRVANPSGDADELADELAERCQQMLEVMETRPATLVNSTIRGYLVRRRNPCLIRRLRCLCPMAYRDVGG
jgi:hypothetical protein